MVDGNLTMQDNKAVGARLISPCCCSVTQLGPALCSHMNGSTPGFLVLQEFAETRVPWVGDTIQPPHPLPPSILLPLIFPSIRVLPEELASDISLQHLYVEPRIQPSPQRTYALWQLDLIEWQESKAQQMKNSYIISHFRDRLILLHSVVHTLENCAEPSGEALRLKWRGFSGQCCLFWECLSL